MDGPRDEPNDSGGRVGGGAKHLHDEWAVGVVARRFDLLLELVVLDVFLIVLGGVTRLDGGALAVFLLLRLRHGDIDDEGLAWLVDHEVARALVRTVDGDFRSNLHVAVAGQLDEGVAKAMVPASLPTAFHAQAGGMREVAPVAFLLVLLVADAALFLLRGDAQYATDGGDELGRGQVGAQELAGCASEPREGRIPSKG